MHQVRPEASVASSSSVSPYRRATSSAVRNRSSRRTRSPVNMPSVSAIQPASLLVSVLASIVFARAIQPPDTAPSPIAVPYRYPSVRAARTAPTRSPVARYAAYALSHSSTARGNASSRYDAPAIPSHAGPDGSSARARSNARRAPAAFPVRSAARPSASTSPTGTVTPPSSLRSPGRV
jgi:hypothetical protein